MHISKAKTNKKEINLSSKTVVDWLKSEKVDLANKGILISEQVVIDRLIERSLELGKAFSELIDGTTPLQWQSYMGAVIYTAAFWNPIETRAIRDAQSRLTEINTQISNHSNKLANLLKERTSLCNEYDFNADDSYHLCDLIDRSTRQTGHYESHLKPKLDQLRGQYDLKYWPEIDAIVREIGRDAESAEVTTISTITQAALDSRIASRRDYLRALFEAIEEQRGATFRDIPNNFNLTDESLAALTSCALDFVGNDLIDASYIKRFRQTEREKVNA